MADDFGLKIGLEGEKEFKKALSDINQSFKVLGSEMKLVESQFAKNDNSVESLAAKNKMLGKEIEAQKGKIATLKSALDNASSSFGENDRRTQNWQVQLNNAEAALNTMERELQENVAALQAEEAALDEAADSAEELGNAVNESADKSAEAGSKFESVGSIAKRFGIAIGAAVVAISAAAVAAGVELVKLGDEYNKAVNQIAASTGASGEELKSLGTIAQNVYAHNFGDNLDDVANGISTVQRTTGLMNDELQKATESGFALRDTFGYELQESSRAASALMKNFGVTAEEAYNIIATGAQNGADQNGDLLDTLNEYSAQYAALGLSADEFLTSLVNGAEAGVFSIDKVGDAVKEFNIRAKDGSDATKEAFTSLGMNADEMTAKFASGGESAKEAFFEVVNALDSMEDPMAKNTAAVALFGTMYEDLEANVLPVLAGMEDGAIDCGNALAEINKIKYADLDSALEGTKRSIEGVFLPTVSGLSAGITDALSNLGNAINEANGDFSLISEAIGTAMQEVMTTVLEYLPILLETVGSLMSGLGTAIINSLPMIIETAGQIVFSIVQGLIAALPQLTEGALQLVMTLLNGIMANLPMLIEGAAQMIVTLATGIASALPQLIPAVIQTLVTVVQTLISNLPMILDAALQLITGLAQGILNALPVLIQALPQIITGIIEFLLNAIPQIIETGIQLLTSLVEALPEIITAIVEAIPQIIEGIITAVMAAIPQIIQAGIDLLISLIQALPQIITTIVQAIPQIISGIVNAVLGNIDKIIMAGVQLFVALIQNLPTIIVEIVKAIPQIITGIVSAIASFVPALAEAGLNLIKGLWNGISDAGAWLWNKISGFFGGVVDKIKNFFGIHSPSTLFASFGGYMAEGLGQGFGNEMGSVGDEMTEATAEAGDLTGKVAIEAIKNGILNNMEMLGEPIKALIYRIGEMMAELMPEIMNFGTSADEAIAEGVAEGGEGTVLTRFRELIDKIVKLFASVGNEFKSIGQMIMEGIGAGITSRSSWLNRLIQNYIREMKQRVESMLGIHSPSRVFAEIGGYMAEGMGVGFEGTMNDVRKQMERSIPTSFDSLNRGNTADIVNGLIGGLSPMLAGAGGQAITLKVNLDGKTIAKTVFDPLKDVSKQRGVSLG